MVSLVDEHRDVWPVAVMCRTIGLPERTFHAHKTRPPSTRSISDAVHAVTTRNQDRKSGETGTAGANTTTRDRVAAEPATVTPELTTRRAPLRTPSRGSGR